MGFDTLGYYYFLGLIVCLFWFWRTSAPLLLWASLVFYASFRWEHLALLLFLSSVAHLGGQRLSNSGNRSRELWLYLGITFAPLFAWKVLEARGAAPAFPLGISFFTFHCASYLIDCRRKLVAPERSITRFFLYVSFFPQLVAGPITRAGGILPQLKSLRRPGPSEAWSACGRILLGLLKKFAIANVAWIFVSEVFAHPGGFTGWAVVLAIVAGRYYIYADFSGYTDIAIGSARLLGISLPENFQRPFAAASISEFWRRWHISLSSWIRDYLLFPLVASPMARLGLGPLILITFACLGLWHGFSWNFLLYGLWHGALVALYEATGSWRKRMFPENKLNRVVFPWVTFLFFVTPPTVFFLSQTPGQALAILSAIGGGGARILPAGLVSGRVAALLFTIGMLETYQWIEAGSPGAFAAWWRRRSPALQGCLVAVVLVWIFVTGDFASDTSFLYFRF